MTVLIGHPPVFWDVVAQHDDPIIYSLARQLQNEDTIDFAVGGLRAYDRYLNRPRKDPGVNFGNMYYLDKHSIDL